MAASGAISQDAQRAVRADIDNDAYERHTIFWDADEVVEHLNRYLPERAIPGELEAVRQKLDTLEHFTIASEVRPDGVLHRVEPKKDKVTIAKGTFTFPNTPEGRAVQEDFDRFLEEGGVVAIPSLFIESFEQHEELAKVFGNEKPALIQLGPSISSAPRLVRLEVEACEGPLTYDRLALRLVKSGSRRSEFRTSTEDPFQITIVLENLGPGRKRVSTDLRFKLTGHSAQRARHAARVWHTIAEGATFKLVEAESGSPFLPPQSTPATDTLPADLVQYLDDLAFIEERLGWSLTFSEHVTKRDLLDARELRQILESGSFVESFDTYTATITPYESVDFLAAFPPGETRWLRIGTDEAAYTLLDRTLELGPSYATFVAMLTEEEHKRIADRLKTGAKDLTVTFRSVPGSEGLRHHYRNYLPEEQQEANEAFRDRFPPDPNHHKLKTGGEC